MQKCVSSYWVTFCLTYVAYSVIYITRKNLSLVKTLIQEDIGLSTYFLGAIDSLFLTTYAVLQIFLPSLSDLYGARPLLLCSFFGASICSFVFSLSDTPQAFLLAWCIEGVAHASIFPVFIKTLSSWNQPFPSSQIMSPSTARRHDNKNDCVLGVWTTSQQVGGILATTVAAYFSTMPNGSGWRNSFRAAGAITAAMACILYFFFIEPSETYAKLSQTGPRALTSSNQTVAPINNLDVEKAPNGFSPEASKKESLDCSENITGLAASVSPREGMDTSSSFQNNSDHKNFAKNGKYSPTDNGEFRTSIAPPLRLKLRNSASVESLTAGLENTSQRGFNKSEFMLSHEKSSVATASSAQDFQQIELEDFSNQNVGVLDGTHNSNITKSQSLSIGTDRRQTAITCPRTRLTLLQVMMLPGLLPCGMAYFCVKVVRYAFLFWLPFFLITEMHFAPAAGGYSSMLFEVGGVAGALLSGFIINGLFRGRRLTAAATMCVLAGICLSCFGYFNKQFVSAPGLLLHDEGSSLYDGSHVGRDGSIKETATTVPKLLILIVATLVGFLVAVPDSILGATAATHLCETSGVKGAETALSTATGIVNGLGALGGVAQSYLIATVAETCGWSAVFMFLGGFALTGALCLLSRVKMEKHELQYSYDEF